MTFRCYDCGKFVTGEYSKTIPETPINHDKIHYFCFDCFNENLLNEADLR
jgi:hypothetical protein